MDRLNITKVHLKSLFDVKEGDSLWWMSVDDTLQEAKVIAKISDLLKVHLHPTLHECGIRGDRRDGWLLNINLFDCNPDITNTLIYYTYRDAQGHIENRSLKLFTTRYECMDSRIRELHSRIRDIEDKSYEVADKEFPKNWDVTCPECGHVFQNRDSDWMPIYHNKQGCICPHCNQPVYESPEYCKEIK